MASDYHTVRCKTKHFHYYRKFHWIIRSTAWYNEKEKWWLGKVRKQCRPRNKYNFICQTAFVGPIIYTNYFNTATLQNQFFSPYTFTANTDETSINHDSILKWRPPQKNIQANPPKSQLSVTFYHLNIKEKIKYFKTKKVNS